VNILAVDILTVGNLAFDISTKSPFSAFVYHWRRLAMIFDPRGWSREAVAILASTVASLYATLLCCVYVAFTFTELVTYPKYKVSKLS
jgi:hypothetical protein